jgi:hypothetical protein
MMKNYEQKYRDFLQEVSRALADGTAYSVKFRRQVCERQQALEDEPDTNEEVRYSEAEPDLIISS